MPLPLLALAGIAGGASAIGSGLQGYFGAKGAEKAANIQARGADKSRALLEKYYGQAMGTQQPYLEQGGKGLQAYSQGVLGNEFQTDVPQFQQRQFDLQADPGFQFRLQQGTNAINNRASAGGSSLGGGVLKELARYGQGIGSEEAGNAYNRFNADRGFDYGVLGDLYNRQVQQQGIRAGGLQNLTGIGQQAAGNVSNLATGLGSSLGDLELQKANSSAAGTAAGYNALGGFFGGLGSNLGGLASLYGMSGGFGGQGMGGGMGQGMTQAPPMGYRPQLGQTPQWQGMGY